MQSLDLTEYEIEPYPLASTLAARMLTEAFERVWKENGVSQRQLAPRLGYRNSVPLSHMALGRIPIPVEKVSRLAHLLDLHEGELLLAVLDQRHPNARIPEVLTVKPGLPAQP